MRENVMVPNINPECNMTS